MGQEELQASAEQMVPLNEVKVVFLGDGEAGKSYIISRLMADGGEPMAYTDLSTPGISIQSKYYAIDGRQVTVHFWDFGGQEILHSMHRMFLTEQTLYVVVVNAREGECDKRAEYWLRCLACYAPNAPVVLALNKYDLNPNARVDNTKLTQEYRSLKQIIKMSALNMSSETFNIGFTQTLLDEIKKTGFLEEKWPVSWMGVKRELESMSEHRITGKEFLRICEDHRVMGNRKELLWKFNNVGVSLCFSDEQDIALRDNVVLRPEWITNALYIILFNQHEFARNGLIPHQSIYDLLYRAGKDLNVRCVLPGGRYTPDDMQYVLAVMRKFRLSYNWNGDCEFIPALCRHSSNVDVRYYQRESEILEFHMEFEYLPANLLYMLMVQRYSELDIDNTWSAGASFRQKETGMNAIAVIAGNVLQVFIRSTDGSFPPNTYMAELKADVDRLSNEMGLQILGCQLIYKLDGKRESFDYEELKTMLDCGETRVYSKLHRRMIPITEILNRIDPDEYKANRLAENITRACVQIQSFPHHQTEKSLDRALQFYLSANSHMDVRSGNQLAHTGELQPNETDLVLLDQHHNPLTVIGTLKICGDNLSMRSWDHHLTKLLHDRTRGLSPLFLISFAECTAEEYPDLWKRFSDHMRRYSPERGKLLTGSYEEIENADNEWPYLKTAKCRYFIGGRDVTVYAYFVRVQMRSSAEEEIQHPTPEYGENVSGAIEVEKVPEKETTSEEAADQSETTSENSGKEEPEYEELQLPGPSAEKMPNPGKRPAQKSLLKKMWSWLLGKQKKLVYQCHTSGKIGKEQVLKECRVVFLGDSEAGKSLIMSRVENPKMNPARFHGNTTIGINIFSRVETIAKQKVRVNYWDFGGQEILHSMHRMFLGEKTVYVIILNTRNDNQDAQADFWLRYVEAYAPNAPVMLVMNKIDQNKRASLNLTVLRRQFVRKLDDSNVLKISAMEKNPKKFQENFHKQLIRFIEGNADCIHSFSTVEAQIRDEVERKQEKVFRMYDFFAICQKRGLVENDQYDLLNRFNEAGVLVSFGTTKPMFLNPKWITSLIYKVLDQGDEIADNGVVSYIRLSTICENNPDKWKGAEDAHFLVQIMVDYDLAVICKKKGTDGKAESEKILIPMLCRREEPKEIQKLIRKNNPVEMRMVFEYLPGGVLYKLIADYNREQDNQLNPDNLWLTGVKFENPSGGYTIVRQEGNTMALYVHDSRKADAVKQLVALSKNIAYIAENLKFNARLNETKISYQIAGVKEYFDYQQLLNAKESGVRLIASTRETDRTDTEKPPKIPVLDVFDQDEGSQKREIEELLQLLLMGCMDLQKDKVFWPVNENARNRQLARTLRGAFITKDQTQGGTSGTGKTEGELDIEILNEKGMQIAILEALRTKSLKTTTWREHLDKLMDNYNTSGLRYLILTTYLECPKEKFEEKFGDTVSHWKGIEPKGFEGRLLEVSKIMEDECPELIHVTRAVYERNNFKVSLYHFVVHIGGTDEHTATV